MRLAVLDGERPGENLLAPLRDALEAEASHRGWDVRMHALRDLTIAPCNGCFGCWIQTPGVCVVDDDARPLAAAVIGSHVLAVLAPVAFGCYGSTAKRAIERMLPLLSPFFETVGGEVHHTRRYPRFPDYLALGIQRDPNEEGARLFTDLVRRNAVNTRSRIHRSGVFPAGKSAEALRPEISALLDAFGEMK
jgi:hypothetical protein